MQTRLHEAEETLQAIRRGDVDALIVEGPHGPRVYTLKGAEQPYRIMVETMQEAAVLLNRRGVILYCNARLGELTGMPVERLTGQVFESLLLTTHRRPFRAFAASGEGRAEFTLLTSDERLVPVAVAASPLEVDGTRSTCLVVTDLTAQKRNEEMAAAERRKDDFIAMLGHELRNPLGPLLHAAHVLGRVAPGEPTVHRAHGMILRQVTHMAKIVDDLLDVSRINRGLILLRTEPVDLVPIVRTTLDDHRNALEAKGLRLEVHLPDTPIVTRGDPTRLAQILGNLLHNAVKFTDVGTVTVRLAVEGGTATLTVADSGLGMEPRTLATLFDSFSQADRSLDRSRGGLGLGLALVKGLVALHGGRVHASSEGLGRGTSIVVRLPLRRSRAAAVRRRQAPASNGTRAFRVLVIEDNVDAAESLKTLLSLSGHTVAVAHTGGAGVELARAFQPEVVLCDIGLPAGMDGYEVARALRAEPRLGNCRLVALTGYGSERDQQAAAAAGFDLHLVKPVDATDLDRLLGGASHGAVGECR